MKQTSKYNGQISISRIWLIGGFILILLFVFVTIPRVETGDSDHYKWIINYLSPGLTLVTSALIYSTNNRDKLKQKMVDNFFLKLVWWASLLYLLCLLAILVATPVGDAHNQKVIDFLNQFSLPLNFLQTILLSLLGIFFVKDDTGQAEPGA